MKLVINRRRLKTIKTDNLVLSPLLTKILQLSSTQLYRLLSERSKCINKQELRATGWPKKVSNYQMINKSY